MADRGGGTGDAQGVQLRAGVVALGHRLAVVAHQRLVTQQDALVALQQNLVLLCPGLDDEHKE